MSRIRTIKPEFFRHEALYEAEVATDLPLRVAFAGMWTVADREGRFRWRPRVIKLDVLPFDDIDFETVLNALIEHGFLIKYEMDGALYGCIPSFLDHQHINQHEAVSTIPAHDADGARTCTHIHAHGEGKGREGEEEGNDRASHDARAHAREPIDDPDFAAFWDVYPHKVGKPAAKRAWPAAKKRAGSLAALLDGLYRYKSDKPPGREWLNPATFLNQDRFNDQPAPASEPSRADKPHDTIFRALAKVATNGSGVGERQANPDGPTPPEPIPIPPNPNLDRQPRGQALALVRQSAASSGGAGETVRSVSDASPIRWSG